MLKTADLFDLSHTLAAPLLRETEYPWEALPKIGDFILKLGQTLSPDEYDSPAPGVWIAKDAKVAPTAFINAPCIIGHQTEVRHCAFIRGNALVGDGAVVGNSTEVKNAIISDGVEVPHYNYVGDSIMGYKSHLGAGAVTSNIKSDRTNVVIKGENEQVETGLRKMGAMVGDHTEVGCNSVLNPGTVLGRNVRVYPLSNVRGVVPENHIYKAAGNIVPKR